MTTFDDCIGKKIKIVDNFSCAIEGIIKKAHQEGDITVIDEFEFTGVSADEVKNAACDEKAASAKDLKRKMMEYATSYKTPCAHPIEQVQKTYCPQEGVYECYCHNCGERWWVEKHE